MTDREDRSAPLLLTLPNTDSGGEASASNASTQQLTMDGVTVHNGPQVGGPVSSQQRIDVYLGKTLEGRYVVESLLGEGGMGFVYLGRHKVIDKRIAIKILRSDLAADAEMTERFLNEAKAASAIGNPHIVDISDYGRLGDGAAFFVMEFLEGPSLAELMTHQRVVSVSRLIHIAKQIARGLSAAHARGIVHRDLKPDNVMLITRGDDKDFVKILDFGIAKITNENQRLTRAGSVFGTPHYMSPEQAAGVPVDQRTDIYSLGVILYEMASGKVPFDADNFMGILTQHMYKAPAPIRAIVPQPQDVPPGLEAIVLKALSKKTDLRYQTMEEVILDLEKIEKGMVPDAVAEMMGRSGGFNVPADYFRNPKGGQGGVAMMPGTPGGMLKRKPILVGAISGAILLLGIVGVVLIVSATRTNASNGNGNGNTPTAATTTGAIELDPSAATTGAGVGVPDPPPQITTSKLAVLVTTEPVDATIAIDNGTGATDAPQQQPRTIAVDPNEKVKIVIAAPGYKSVTRVLDGKNINHNNPRVVYRLEREPVAAGKPNAKATPPITTPKTTAPAASTAPVPTPASTVRPANCPAEDWDMFTHKCNRH